MVNPIGGNSFDRGDYQMTDSDVEDYYRMLEEKEKKGPSLEETVFVLSTGLGVLAGIGYGIYKGIEYFFKG